MTIECKRGDACTIEEVLNDADERTPSIINQILWFMTARQLGLELDLYTIGGDRFPSIHTKDLDAIFPSMCKTSCKNLAILHNTLLDVYEMVEKEYSSPWQFQDCDPAIARLNPSCRLISTAMDWLLDQMEIIEKCLNHSMLV
eukprot:CAMPEP_0197245184 /NCGR_PEP_ID=MMETSP1429-20130617/10049_1 /TAXON_ID=49237 /ORGANISM="Chaetoceros  sp., Strain UNC1202" /LENGTH=142 /DNA_ID=CAMNT_0042705635 /DNA_START=71 /DNA_END=499 /DNA_ORIENTATION=-